jgi:hypothetical protein
MPGWIVAHNKLPNEDGFLPEPEFSEISNSRINMN